MLDWLVIGGGVQGTVVSRFLIGSGRVKQDRLAVVDPWPRPLERFLRNARNCGMDYLRSSIVHHLDEDPWSLRDFAAAWKVHPEPFLGPYRRPRLDLFRDHSLEVVRGNRLDDLRMTGSAIGARRLAGGWSVETDRGELRTRRLVLALGASRTAEPPSWAAALFDQGLAVDHLFDVGFDLGRVAGASEILVVGGGISALQAALCLSTKAPGRITVLSRHPVEQKDFDTDSTWLGPRQTRAFERLVDASERRSVIDAARHRGSTPRDVLVAFGSAIDRGEIRFLVGEVSEATLSEGRAILHLGDSPACLKIDAVVLATGYDSGPPQGSLFDSIASDSGVKLSPCGFPLVSQELRWDSGLYVTGPLAELELGPTARNIHGAREAGRRLAAVATDR